MVNAPARRTAPHITVINGQPTTTSRDIAETFGKRHDDVLKRIRALNCSPEFTARNFAASDYTDPTGRTLTEYRITRDGFAFLCMGFTGAKAAQWKERYINTFNQMAEKLATAPALPAPTRNRSPDHWGNLLPLPAVILEPARTMLDAAVWRLTGQAREQIADWAARRLVSRHELCGVDNG